MSSSSSSAAEELQDCINSGLVTEEVISYEGIDDILVARITNPTYMLRHAGVLVLTKMEANRSFGFSLLDMTLRARRHFMGVVNYRWESVYSRARPKAGPGMFKHPADRYVAIDYPLPRYSDTIEQIIVRVPKGVTNSDQYHTKVEVIRTLPPQCRCRAEQDDVLKSTNQQIDTEIVVKLDKPIDYAHDRFSSYYLRVVTSNETFQRWTTVDTIITGAHMSDSLRSVRMNTPWVPDNRTACPHDCEYKLIDRLKFHGRVDKLPDSILGDLFRRSFFEVTRRSFKWLTSIFNF